MRKSSLHCISVFATAMTFAFTQSSLAQTADAPPPDTSQLITEDVLQDIDSWLDNEIVKLSINAQNERYGPLTAEKINALDAQWVREREELYKPLIAATLSNPLSVYLSRIQGQSVGLFVEVFIMDNKGLNVGQSSITGDFWQGDEAKFKNTFPKGPDALFIDEPEFDDKFGIWRAQINKTVTADDGVTPIGAATIEVNLTELQRRQNLAK